MTATDTRKGMPWSELVELLEAQGFEFLVQRVHTANGYSRHLVAAHLGHRLLVNATSTGPRGGEAVRECIMYGTLRQGPDISGPQLITALAWSATESLRVSRDREVPRVFAFNASYVLGLAQVIEALTAAGDFVNWHLNPDNPGRVIRLHPATGLERDADWLTLFRYFMVTCPHAVRDFIRKPW